MALSTSIVKPVEPAPGVKPDNTSDISGLLALTMLSALAATKSKKALRKMQRQLLWQTFKAKMRSLFDRKAVSDRTLIYILLGVALLALLFIEPIAALVVVLVALILILAEVI